MKPLPPEAKPLPNTEAKIVLPPGMSERDKGIIYTELSNDFINQPPKDKQEAYQRMAQIMKSLGYKVTPYKGPAFMRRKQSL